MECLLGVSCRGLKHYKNNGFALFGWEEGWPKGGPGSVQEGLSWARESDQKMLKTRAGRKRKYITKIRVSGVLAGSEKRLIIS